MLSHFRFLYLIVVTILIATSSLTKAGPIRDGFQEITFARNDDGTVGPINVGFTMNFFGMSRENLFINNNGNITFDRGLSTYTPFAITGGSTPMIAPFFADVDTRRLGEAVTYGTGVAQGREAFAVNWFDVAHYNRSGPLNSFQLVLIDRSDTGLGNFDFEFNYESILWESGQASGSDSRGLGGTSARAGWTNGDGTYFEIDGSGVNGSFLDSAPLTGLIYTSNVNISGRYLFTAREGQVRTIGVPEPGAMLLTLVGFIFCIVFRKNPRKHSRPSNN